MKNKKVYTFANTYRAFTFAELMVSLVIIAVITALLYPTIAEISPNNNKQLYRSAYKTVELTVQDIIASPINSNGYDAFSSEEQLCQAFKDRLNTVSWTVDNSLAALKTSSGCDTNASQELHTSNGMRWWFYNLNSDTFTIYIDVNASNNGDNFDSVACDGNITDDPNNFGTSPYWTKGCFRIDNDVQRDTFKIQITKTGKVIADIDDIGARHLRDDTD